MTDHPHNQDGMPARSFPSGTSPHTARFVYDDPTQSRYDWETPPTVFDPLQSEFEFQIDVCALPSSAKCDLFWTPEDDGLAQDWLGMVCWMNPPYNRTGPWLQKAYQESLKGSTVACLIAARPETKYWREWVWERACEIRFYTGRISFLEDGQPQGSPKFPSALVVYYGRCEYRPGGVDNHRHHHPIVRRVDRP